jgi:hypothetical protein
MHLNVNVPPEQYAPKVTTFGAKLSVDVLHIEENPERLLVYSPMTKGILEY